MSFSIEALTDATASLAPEIDALLDQEGNEINGLSNTDLPKIDMPETDVAVNDFERFTRPVLKSEQKRIEIRCFRRPEPGAREGAV